MNFSMRANGKVLLTGEYFVTEGAVALALPTQLGQQINISDGDEAGVLQWNSYDKDGNTWFSARLQLKDFSVLESSGDEGHEKTAERLSQILRVCRQMNGRFLADSSAAVKGETHLEFPLEWGLGSSSTLVALIANWAGVDAFQLLEKTFGGSGYDIAAATAKNPILFQKFNGKNRWDSARFAPSFHSQLYFVHLNKKQDSRDALVHYMVTPAEEREVPLPRISQITHNISAYTNTLEEFEKLILEHEQLVQRIVKQPRAKELFFSDYWGEVKSLGAWGGDFVLVTSNRSEAETRAYFEGKGFTTILRYDELIA